MPRSGNGDADDRPALYVHLGFDGGIFVTTDVPTGTATQAVGINDRGEIVGVYTSAGRSHGFVLD